MHRFANLYSHLSQAQSELLQQFGDPAAAPQIAWQFLNNSCHEQAAART
jgi:hypothetical protein